jgi:hypothetical protein
VEDQNDTNEKIIETAQQGFIAIASHMFKNKQSVRSFFPGQTYDGFKNGVEVEFMLDSEFVEKMKKEKIQNMTAS